MQAIQPDEYAIKRRIEQFRMATEPLVQLLAKIEVSDPIKYIICGGTVQKVHSQEYIKVIGRLQEIRVIFSDITGEHGPTN